MKKIRLLLLVFSGLLFALFASGQTALTFRLANPSIVHDSGTDYLSFDVQVKAAASGSYLWSGQAMLNFDNTTFSTSSSNWAAMKGTLLTGSYLGANQKYGDPLVSITGNPAKVNIAWTAQSGNLTQTSYGRFNEVPQTYVTLVTVFAPITNSSGSAGILFDQESMNGQQFYKLLADPWYAGYNSPNNYEGPQFMDLYVGRIYANGSWTQVGGAVNWGTSVATSVWEGTPTLPGGSELLASNFHVHTGATVTIPNNGKLTVSGITWLYDNGLVIQSDATSTGSLITSQVWGAGTTQASVQRYMSGSKWHMLASPVSQSISGFLGANSAIPTKNVNERGMMEYITADNAWSSFFTNSKDGSTDAGKGFMVRTTSDAAVTLTGSPNSGTVNKLVHKVTVDGNNMGWNLIGNPYSSAIKVNDNAGTNNFLTTNSGIFDPNNVAIYVWDETYSTSQYKIINNAGDADVASLGQAFLVKPLAIGASNVQFTKDMQVHAGGTALKSGQTAKPEIKLLATNGGKSISTSIKFLSGMSRGLDPGYDAGFLALDPSIALYTRLVTDNGVNFAIQCLPDNDFSNMIIPVGIESKAGGEVVFSAESVNLGKDCMVILEDKLAKTFTDLGKNVYKANLDANTKTSERFQIHTSYLTTGLDMDYFRGKLSAYAIRNVEIRVKGEVSSQAVATLYDATGRLVLNRTLEAGSLNILRTPGFRSGAYMLFVKDGDKAQGFKVMLREW
jgi:hypothetical protein